ncbi:MAG: hypothetical protein IPP03_02230 [Dechloromonas sp.]|nr:hypothetical protein [Candidatus Dechloromonas phosphoritropha]
MKVILGRKGFDSSTGGCASPIFPDGSLFPLSIPASNAPAASGDTCHPARPNPIPTNN